MIKAIKICLLAVAIFPLVFDTSVFFPYTSAKTLFFQAILILVSLLFTTHLFLSKKFRKETFIRINKFIKSPLTWSIIFFVFSYIISTLLAVDKTTAFWGNIVRGEGLVGIISYFIFFVFTALIFDRKDWLWFFKISIITTLVVLSNEFYQYYIGNIPRPDSFTGNPTYLSGYLIFSIVSALLVLVSSFFSLFFHLFVQSFGFAKVENDNSSPLCHSRVGGNPRINDMDSNFHGNNNRVFSNKINHYFWSIFSLFIIALSFLGILLTGTRGTLLGVCLGVFTVLVYFSIKGKNINYKIFNLREVSLGIILFLVLFSGIFFFTRQNQLWQKIPGLSRIATIDIGYGNDYSTSVRLLAYESSLNAIGPHQNGLLKTIFGWGPDNYILAYGKYYNPSQYKYEETWLDRPHNKILDLLTMTGLLGLLSYLGVWVSYLFVLFKRKSESEEQILKFFPIKNILIFYTVSYLFYLLFVFDQITTSLPFFAILSFVFYLFYVSSADQKSNQNSPISLGLRGVAVKIVFPLILLFLIIIFTYGTWPAYRQMREYSHLVKNFSSENLNKTLGTIFTPMTNVQSYIITSLLKVITDNYHDSLDTNVISTLEKILTKGEEYTISRPNDFIFQYSLADAFGNLGHLMNNQVFLNKGEHYSRQALSFAPNRQDLNYTLALNLAYQKRYTEALALVDNMIDLEHGQVSASYYKKGIILYLEGETYYKQSLENFEKAFSLNNPTNFRDVKLENRVYFAFAKYFYKQRDREDFTIVVNRFKAAAYQNTEVFSQILDYIKINNSWPQVNFN